jgi:hypothetical protein
MASVVVEARQRCAVLSLSRRSDRNDKPNQRVAQRNTLIVDKQDNSIHIQST